MADIKHGKSCFASVQQGYQRCTLDQGVGRKFVNQRSNLAFAIDLTHPVIRPGELDPSQTPNWNAGGQTYERRPDLKYNAGTLV